MRTDILQQALAAIDRSRAKKQAETSSAMSLLVTTSQK